MAEQRPAARLARLISRLPANTEVAGDLGTGTVTGIEIDSRAVRPGALFVAVRGAQADGHDYVSAAVANGAVAVVAETASPQPVAVVKVSDSRRALSTLAAAFFDDPSRSLDVLGVTGTNGKTTTVAMIRSVLDRAGKPCGTIGTVGAAFGDRRWTLANTTPLPPELHGLLAAMLDTGATAVAMEVSSHALALDRVDDVRFRVAALTNVTRDHLDFHQTPQAYAAAKRRLFAMAQTCVLNLDDECGARWAPELMQRGISVVTYSRCRADATLEAAGIVGEPDGSRFTLDGRPYHVRIPGIFNVSNALAAIGVARTLGIDDATIAEGLAQLERVPGRMERFGENGVDVVVDYAHTPDALESVLRSLRETVDGHLAVVFGCGGDRDRGKRPLMGAAAARYADRLYVTSDNPRSEDPEAIAREIVAGIGSRAHAVELDRRRAIDRAVVEARPGDTVLIAGKGHETYQIVGDRVLDFDDAAVARAALQLRGAVR
jgi:UDP-N-acetylmuramoyl-L-alanyl-D-glutamate--2,6-diaminopimelate ligase